jgi:phosphatidylserine decarboxylase
MKTSRTLGDTSLSDVMPAKPRWRDRLLLNEDLNFLLTNRIPRIALTRLMGHVSRIRSPGFTRLAIGVWRLFTELDLSEAVPQGYESLQQVFTRALRPGLRPLDARDDMLTSPCDGIVGACGPVVEGQVWQAKGFPYAAGELFGEADRAAPFEGGRFITLRLTSSMYHRFHAPHDSTIEHVSYLSGDAWNVNPIALKRVERLFCRNERALIRMKLDAGPTIALVPVAAVLVASIRLHALNVLLHLRWPGPTEMPCDTHVKKGEELGWFEHGSTIIVFAPPGFELVEGIEPGRRVRMGEALMHLPTFVTTPAEHRRSLDSLF